MEMESLPNGDAATTITPPAVPPSRLNHIAESLKLEHQFLKVPFEHFKKNMRTNHRIVEKEMNAVISSVAEAADKDMSKEEAVEHLTSLVSRLQGLKRKLEESNRSEQLQAQRCRARLDHLDGIEIENQSEWNSTRVKRILVDYMLHMTYYDTAMKLAESGNIQDFVDIDVFLEAKKVIDALQSKEVAPALAWCADNKSRLKKSKSKFEFQLRLQEFIELVRAESKTRNPCKIPVNFLPPSSPTPPSSPMDESETKVKAKARGKPKPKPKPKRMILRQEDLSAILSVVGTAVVFTHRFLSENDLLLLPGQTIALESSIGTSATSIIKLNSLFALSNNLSIPRALNPPFSCWFHRFSSSVSENDPRWFENFRMLKPTFTQLLKIVISSLNTFETCKNGGSYKIPPDYKLGAALFRLAHAASFKMVGKRFGMDSAGACRSFYEVCKALQDKLGHLVELGSDSEGIIRGFSRTGLVNCCGVLGFSRFFVERDNKGELEGERSVVLQAVVDSEGRFLDYSVGWSGSLTPDVILSRTRLFSRVEREKELLNGVPVELANGFLMPQYMLGDSCCPLLPWLLTPYLGSNGSDEFNSVHGFGMSLATKAFGRIRSLWRLLLLRQKAEYAEFLSYIIPAACVLNNFLIMCGEHMPDETVNYSELPFPVYDEKNQSAETIRDALASHINLVNSNH